MTVNPVAFYVISAAVLGGALAVVTLRNIVHAAVSLVGTLFMVGALYFAIGAYFNRIQLEGHYRSFVAVIVGPSSGKGENLGWSRTFDGDPE